MAVGRESREIQALRNKIEALQKSLKSFEALEERIGETIEERVFEIKALAYVILIISVIMLAITLGTLIKTLMK